MTWGREFWTWFLIVTGVTFLLAETVALFTNLNNTLSRYARDELGIHLLRVPLQSHTWAWFISLAVWIVAAAYLTWHIWFEVGFRA